MRNLLLFLVALCLAVAATGCDKARKGYKLVHAPIAGDPLSAYQYELDNGLKVFVSVTTGSQKAFGAVAVKAGGKFDPADDTGLAHYLEHMLFKGSDKLGSLDYAAEKPVLDQIEALYETHRQTVDPAQRQIVYAKIDSLSGVAAKFAVANEYDKLIDLIGGQNANAFTDFDITCYHELFHPANLSPWLKLQAERFRNPVFRLFHTELEAVYEEKNISLDSDYDDFQDSLMNAVLPFHPYGRQSVIGRTEHLKNPSWKVIRAYFDKYYVPGNMAVCLSGALDPEAAAASVAEAFGAMVKKEVPPLKLDPETPMTGVVEKTVLGPEKEYMMLAFRGPAINHADYPVLKVIDQMLQNGAAGLFDIHINRPQKGLNVNSELWENADYVLPVLYGETVSGQSFGQLDTLMRAEIERLVSGNFDDALLAAVKLNLKNKAVLDYRTVQSRSVALANRFAKRIDPQTAANQYQSYLTVNKADIMRCAKSYFSGGSARVIKKKGSREQARIVKPKITPVAVNRESHSKYYADFKAALPETDPPVLLDYAAYISSDLPKDSRANNDESDESKANTGEKSGEKSAEKLAKKDADKAPIYAVQNVTDSLSTAAIVYVVGTDLAPELELISRTLAICGAGRNDAKSFYQRLYTLGASLKVWAEPTRTALQITAPDGRMAECLSLADSLMRFPNLDDSTYAGLTRNFAEEREDEKFSPDAVRSAVSSYAFFGKDNPFRNQMSPTRIAGYTADSVRKAIRQMADVPHAILYFGPRPVESVRVLIPESFAYNDGASLLGLALMSARYKPQELATPTTYFAHYEMVQAEVTWQKSVGMFAEKSEAARELFNYYYGGSMAGIIFQTLRESKALAYSANARVAFPNTPNEPYRLVAYIGTQADKFNEALTGMELLLDGLPVDPAYFETSKSALMQSFAIEYPERMDLLYAYTDEAGFGADRRLQSIAAAALPAFTFDDLKAYHAQTVARRPRTLAVLGDSTRIRLTDAAKFGAVKVLSYEEIFGF